MWLAVLVCVRHSFRFDSTPQRPSVRFDTHVRPTQVIQAPAAMLLARYRDGTGQSQSKSIAAFRPSSTSRRSSDGNVPILFVSFARSSVVT